MRRQRSSLLFGGQNWFKFLAVLATVFCNRMIWRKGWILPIFFILPGGANHPTVFSISSWCKIANKARNWNNSAPQAAATTFAFSHSLSYAEGEGYLATVVKLKWIVHFHLLKKVLYFLVKLRLYSVSADAIKIVLKIYFVFKIMSGNYSAEWKLCLIFGSWQTYCIKGTVSREMLLLTAESCSP